MSKIDWDKPIEYKLYVHGVETWVPCKVGYFNPELKCTYNRLCEYTSNDRTGSLVYGVTWIDKDGNNSGVPVVRNKKEKKKITIHIYRRKSDGMFFATDHIYEQSVNYAEKIDTIEREYEI